MKINFYNSETKCLKLKKEENTFFYEQSTEKIVIFCGKNENHTIFNSNEIIFYQNDKKIKLKDQDKENIHLSIKIFTKNETILSDESIVSYYFNFLINSSIYLTKNIKTFIEKTRKKDVLFDMFNLKLDNNFYKKITKKEFIYSKEYYENIFILTKLLYIRDMFHYKKEIKKEIIELKLQVL